MNNLLKRIIVAIIGIPLAIFLIWYGGIPFAVVVFLITAGAVWEFLNITSKKGFTSNKIFTLIMAIALQTGTWGYLRSGMQTEAALWFICISAVYVIVNLILQMYREGSAVGGIGASMTAFFYLPVFFLALLLVRDFYYLTMSSSFSGELFSKSLHPPDNFFALFVIFIFFTIWICDSAAYFYGKAFGKRKLFEKISPKKTWEGSVAGFIAAVISFSLFSYFLLPEFSSLHAAVIGSLIGVIGQYGDLAVSQFKRDAGVKDSSNILPGHGGILDRFDSVLFSFPVILIYLIVLSVS